MRTPRLLLLSLLLPLLACESTGDLDPEPAPLPEDCGTFYPDVDGDGLGDDRLPVTLCEDAEGYVSVGGDEEPDCPTNDTDDCGVCAGGNADQDCTGTCFGGAWVDGCGDCTGGNTGLAPAPDEDWDGDGLPDSCDQCPAEPTDRFVVEYSAVPHFSGAGGPYSAEVVLHGNGDILLQYGDIEPYEASATVGLQAPDGTVGQTLSHLDSFLLESRAVWLSHPGDGEIYGFDPENSPPASFFELTAVGTSVGLADDDSVELGIPFSFPFYDQSFDTIRVSSNGFLMLGGGDLPGYGNVPLPTGELGGMIAVFWDDLNPAVSGTIRTAYSPAGCERDCAGMWGGFAQEDACGMCAGGTTGRTPGATVDCAGDCDGEAWEDDCGICVGGSTGLEPSDPSACPQLPDFMPDVDYLGDTVSIDYVDVEDDDCLVAEGCVNGTGMRKVLRFGTRVGNVGTSDFYLGVPPGPNFYWDGCHGHYHYEDYASYELLDPATGAPAALGHKNGFCLLDSGVFDAALAAEHGNDCNTYNCNNQGIGAGCHDTYGAHLDCQWIDVTDVADGSYELSVTLNPYEAIEELDWSNNTATVEVVITGDSVELSGVR